MALFIRGINPVWSFVDLTGKQFDDTFYMWVLQNEIPYIPATVWHDQDGNVEWTDPIQFLANGTLPVDIFWDPDTVYRLEFRQHIDPLSPPTQSDPLIYLVENYVPGRGGSSPITAIGLFTDNQITNAQFSLISFSSPTTFTGLNNPDPIEVAPGWFLDLVGSGNLTLEQVPLNSALANPTNAPFALHLTLSGTFSSAILRQRFQQNGMLWAGKYVSCSVTAKIQGAPQTISAQLVDSMGASLVTVLRTTPVNSAFNEYTDFGLVPATTNTNTPPAAWIDFELTLPTAVNIYLTSFQLIASDIPTAFPYEQDSIDRQIDHTWHNYRDSVLTKAKASILTGWNFSLNPWQTNTRALTTAASQTQYIADQTIIHQLAGSTVKTGKTGVRNNLQVQALNGVTNNRFAIIQYIDPATILPYWSYLLSSLARARIFTSHGTSVGIKMRLIWSTGLPATLSSVDPIASWADVDPVFSGSWTPIAPLNDPEYILPNSYSTTESGNAFPAFAFDSFQMPDWNPSFPTTMTLGIVIYTTENMDSSLGTEDSIEIDRISLVPNEFAIDSPPQTADQVLRECQYYYEDSRNYGFREITMDSQALPGASPQPTTQMYPSAFTIDYETIKRAIVTNISIYSAVPTIGNVTTFLFYANGAGLIDFINPDVMFTSFWELATTSLDGISFRPIVSVPAAANPVASVTNGSGGKTVSSSLFFVSGVIGLYYIADARLGI